MGKEGLVMGQQEQCSSSATKLLPLPLGQAS